MSAQDRFWAFVAERHRVWARRTVPGVAAAENDPVLLERPWTHDPTIARYRFTNVYRELDRGTLFWVYEIGLAHRDPLERVFQTLQYRLLNRMGSYLELRQAAATFDAKEYARRVATMRAAGRPIVGTAFTLYTSVNGPGQGYINRLGPALRRTRDAMTRDGIPDLPDVEWVRGLAAPYRIGRFIAQQIVLDLTMRRLDRHVHVGPGSARALRALGYDATPNNLLDLCDAQHRYLPSDLRRPRRVVDGVPMILEPHNVEHALCEWQKYENLRANPHITTRSRHDRGWEPPSWLPPWWC